jgi:hypothetical protein
LVSSVLFEESVRAFPVGAREVTPWSEMFTVCGVSLTFTILI